MDKRISALAMAIQMGATVYDLEETELCYAPQFGSAKDPVNFSGMIAADVIRGDMPICHWDSVDGKFLLDVREPVELAVEEASGAVNIPLAELRGRLDTAEPSVPTAAAAPLWAAPSTSTTRPTPTPSGTPC